jgi:preprotein translocase subunit SecF
LEEGKNIAEMIQTQIQQDFPQNNFEIRSITDIGPKIGGELRRAALMATFLALLGILIYVAWRFEFKFAVGAVFALFHDTFITFGVFVFLNMEFNLTVLAAFLTLIGYSINDTIVVYDRIRENLKILRRENLGNVINISVNQTLGRTLITGVTTLMVCIVLFFFGGEVVHNFAFAMIFGIVIGTYSSVFVASPMVYEWHAWEEKKKGAKAKPLLRTMR